MTLPLCTKQDFQAAFLVPNLTCSKPLQSVYASTGAGFYSSILVPPSTNSCPYTLRFSVWREWGRAIPHVGFQSHFNWRGGSSQTTTTTTPQTLIPLIYVGGRNCGCRAGASAFPAWHHKPRPTTQWKSDFCFFNILVLYRSRSIAAIQWFHFRIHLSIGDNPSNHTSNHVYCTSFPVIYIHVWNSESDLKQQNKEEDAVGCFELDANAVWWMSHSTSNLYRSEMFSMFRF